MATLTIFRTCCSHRPHTFGQVPGNPLEVVRRQHDALPAGRADQLGRERRLELQINASAPRWSAQSSSFLRSDSASLNAPPSHSGRHVTIQAGPIRPANAPVTSGSLTESRRSSTSKHHLGRRIAPTAQLCRRGCGNGDDKQRFGHKKAPWNLSAEEAWLAPGYVGLRPRQLPLQSGRNTTIQNQTGNSPAIRARSRSAWACVWSRP